MCKKYKARQENFIHRRVAGSDILVPVGEAIATYKGIIEMNETAGVMWDLMKSPVTKAEMAEELQCCYGIDAGQASGDVEDLLELLVTRDMVECL